jgi:hypothetical protein
MQKITFVLLGLTLAACGGPIPEVLVADTVLVDGNVITVDPEDRIAQAVAIKNGRILAVGADAEIRKLAGEDTRSSTSGRTATPGFSTRTVISPGRNRHAPGLRSLLPEGEEYPGRSRRRRKQVEGRQAATGSRAADGTRQARGARYIYASDLDPISGRTRSGSPTPWAITASPTAWR